MSFSDHLGFATRGFSLHRMAYLLDVVALALWPLYDTNDSLGRNAVGAAAFGLFIGTLVLCLFTKSTVRHRWLPSVIGFIVLSIGLLRTPL